MTSEQSGVFFVQCVGSNPSLVHQAACNYFGIAFLAPGDKSRESRRLSGWMGSLDSGR